MGSNPTATATLFRSQEPWVHIPPPPPQEPRAREPVLTGVLVLTGPPCSGKSAVGRLLVPALVPVEVDAIFDRLMPDSDRNRDDRLRAYGAAHVMARRVLDSGRQPYLECTYARRAQRASLVAALPDVPLFVVELAITPDKAVARFAEREQDTDLTEESLRAKVEAFPWSDQALRLEPGPPTELAWRILTWLENGPVPIDAEAWVAVGCD